MYPQIRDAGLIVMWSKKGLETTSESIVMWDGRREGNTNWEMKRRREEKQRERKNSW